MDLSSGRGRRKRKESFGPLAFVVVSLLALVVLPVAQERRVTAIQEHITGVLDPARERAQDLALLHAQQMSRFQSYLLTGDSRFRVRYEGLLREEGVVYARLDSLVERTDLRIRQELAALYAASQHWHLSHRQALEDDDERTRYLELVSEEQARYDDVLSTSRALENAMAGEMRAGRRRVEGERTTQLWLTAVLGLVALVATALVAGIARRLRSLFSEAEGRREDALAARRQMQAVLEATGDGVLGVDLEGRCTSLNRTGSDLLGYPEVDARGRDLHELLHGRAPAEKAHPPGECSALAALRDGGMERVSDDVVWRRDGRPFPAKWHLRPLVDGRKLRGAVLTLSDMTEIREAESALRRAVRARDEVVAVVSHDLRSPLGTIAAAAELVAELDLSPEQEEEQVDIIRRSAGRMGRLIEDLLDVARIEGGGLTGDPRPREVEPIVAESVALFRPAADRAGIELHARVEPGLPEVRVDSSRLEQVLGNLLGNALKFTPRGGRIGIRALGGEGEVLITVADTGRGIAPEDAAHLFDRFWQVESTGRAGAGLGLTIVKGIVEAHGGRVWVESEPGRGSAFHVALPMAEPP